MAPDQNHRDPVHRSSSDRERLRITFDSDDEASPVEAPSRRHVVVADTPERTLGRDPSCDLVLDHPTVGRRHAVVRTDGSQTLIEPGSAGLGVAVNDADVRRATPLVAGDRVAIGPFRAVFDGERMVATPGAGGVSVSAAGVGVEVDGRTILEPTDLTLLAGELVAIVGESGAGKSTLLKALSGVIRPSRGTVLLAGEPVETRLTDVGYVPQFDIVHDQLTVTEALDYAARLRLPADTGPDERARRISAVLEQLGLEERASVRVARLSGGQRKRAAVGIELIHRPGVLFLDEPTTGLDPALEQRLMRLFRRIADDGQTVALVTHATGSLSLVDRVVVMGRGGRLLFAGPPADMLEHFGATTYEEVYVRLGDDLPTGQGPVERRPAGRRPLPPLSTRATRRPVRPALGHQTAVLASRYAKLMARDRRHLRSAALQVPVLGLLTALLFTSGVFNRAADGPATPVFATKAAHLLFLMVTIAFWLGSINAAREIVKERHVLARELAAGVQITAYLASKLLVLGAFATAQTLLFASIVLVLRPLHADADVTLSLISVLVVSSWLAVLLGLAVSAHATSEDQATGVIPLLLVPQLLFGGAIVTLAEMTGVMQVLAAVVPARWSFAAAGNVADLPARIAEDPLAVSSSRYGPGFFDVQPVVFAAIALLFGVALIALVVRSLRRGGVTL